MPTNNHVHESKQIPTWKKGYVMIVHETQTRKFKLNSMQRGPKISDLTLPRHSDHQT